MSSFMDNYFGYILFATIVFLFWRHRKKSKAKAKKIADDAAHHAATAPGIEANRTCDSEMSRLGATKEARRTRIDEIFDRRTETLAMDLKNDALFNNVGISGTIERAVATMPPAERESLRAAYHLYNLDEMSAIQFHLVRLALLYGDGKAQSYNTTWYNAASNNGGIGNDLTDAVKTYTGTTAERTVTTVLKWVEASSKKLPNDPTIKRLKERLLGGGDAALAATADFMAAQNPEHLALILGHAEDGKDVIYTGGRAVITVAPPGSGKTQCHVFPTLLSWKGPAVVLDVKGEIYDATSKWRKENVGPVYKFSPLDPGNSASWNPLATVNSDPDVLWEECRFLADMMLVPSAAKDPFWENRARDVLMAAIAVACLEPDPAKRRFGSILDVFNGIGWDQFIMSLQMAVDCDPMARAGHSLKNLEPKIREGVLQTGLASLSAWDGNRLARVTRKSDWSPLDLRDSEKPPTIYISLKTGEIDSYISVLRVFIAQHMRALLAEELPVRGLPILFMLDEMPRLGNMPPVVEAIDVGRAYKVCPWMFAQSLGQLDEAYDTKIAEHIVATCEVRMYMNPSMHDETAQKISEQIGMQEGVMDNTRQPIVEATTLAGPEYKDFIVALPSGFKPFRVRKNFAYADPVFQSRMGSLGARARAS